VSTGTVFYKMTGSGNDFIVLDGRYTSLSQWPADRIIAICDRRMGAGADGFVILTPTAVPGEITFEFLNNDGSRAGMCGNAALCSTRLSVFLELAPREGMTLLTDSGQVRTRCTGPGHMAEIRVPDFDLPVPLEIEAQPGESGFYLATVGVPHLVVVTADVATVDVQGRGRELRFHPAVGPAGANVNFISGPSRGSGEPWRIRTYERGVEGETLACGTGTVAAAFVADHLGRHPLPAEWLTVRGIRLGVSGARGASKATDAWLLGEGRLVYAGVIQ
jgi:diaminopimelate epimerase